MPIYWRRIYSSIEVFISYSDRDEELCTELEKHLSILEKTHQIQCWHRRKITAGTEWEKQICEHLNRSKIVLLLISSDFLASDYCYGVEMNRAMERHNLEEAIVIPIILRPVFWEGAWCSQLSILPTNAQPVTQWQNRDEAFANITTEIVKVIQSIRQRDGTNPESDSQYLDPSEYAEEWAKQQSVEGNDLYLVALEHAAKWGRQQAQNGSTFWIEAVVAVDQIVVPLRRTWKKLFGKKQKC